MKKHVSRILRRNQTPWELKLWQVIRNKQVKGLKFRRQFKIDKYIVDFCCLEKKLVVELDGGHHDESQNRLRDEVRQKHLEKLGFKVLRFWNNDIDHNLNGVIETIIQNS